MRPSTTFDNTSLYHHTETGRMLIDATRTLSDELVRRLEKSQYEFLVEARQVDLATLADDLKSQVRGGWFGDLKVADVSTIGMFGPTVGESAEWGTYEQVGALSVIDLESEIDGLRLPVKIMANRGVVLYQSFSEAQTLSLLLGLQDVLDEYEIDE